MSNIEQLPEFDNHKAVLFLFDKKSDLKGFIVIHRANSKLPAFGATRLWEYSSETDALKDALKLSKTMSYKAALAGLRCGGAKGVIIKSPSFYKKRNDVLNKYVEYVNLLKGSFITGADVGINDAYLKKMHQRCSYIVGIKSDPVRYTILGLNFALKVCLEEVFGSDKFEKRSFAIQGLGKIGAGLLDCIYSKALKIYVSDINKAQVKKIKRKYPKVIIVKPTEIYKQEVDVFSPCAVSNSITSSNVSQFKCKVILGGANNQLESKQVGEILHKLGILYAPDYVVNAGGLISVYDEYKNRNHRTGRVEKQIAKIASTLRRIIKKSKKENKAINLVANEMGEKLFNRLH